MSGTVLDHAMARVAAARAEISRIKSSDFPREARVGLDHIDAVFLDLHKTLTEDIDAFNDPECIKSVAQDTLEALDRYLPLIGFMLRSTNVRNAFELHGPLVRIARQLLGDATNVVLSSEWEFSPFTYRPIVELPDFVLIGLPASESGNGLIVPLAGHELGHAVYERQDVESNIREPVAATLVSAIEDRWEEYAREFPGVEKGDIAGPKGRRSWEPLHIWALRQCEETFCDFFGLRLFGESFLYAFAYLLAPCLHLRSPRYPSMLARVRHLVSAANFFGTPVPDGFEGRFRDNTDHNSPPSERLFYALADQAASVVIPSLTEQVKKLAQNYNLLDRDEDAIQGALRDFRQVIPARAAPDLATIANAGWMAHQDAQLWTDYSEVVGLIRFRGQVGYVVSSLVSMLSRARADVTAGAPCAAWE